ncbi:hypothetical protein [Bradyrhizobium sp. 23]
MFLNPSTDYTRGLIAAVPSLARGGWPIVHSAALRRRS